MIFMPVCSLNHAWGERIVVIEYGRGHLWISVVGLVQESKANSCSKQKSKGGISGKRYHMAFPQICQQEVVHQWKVETASLYSPNPFPSGCYPAWCIQLVLFALCPGASFLLAFWCPGIMNSCLRWKGVNPSSLPLFLGGQSFFCSASFW